jgi:microcystin-dependent protein
VTIEMPGHNHVLHESPHNHVLSEQPHVHGYSLATNNVSGANSQSGNQVQINWVPANTGATKTNISIAQAITGISIDPVGGNGTHNNMQPTAVVRWMIRT